MARALSQGEVVRLLTQLKTDTIAPGWLRQLLWRQGWMLPPPLFWRVSTDGVLKVALAVMAIFAFGLSVSLWLYLIFCTADIAVALPRQRWRGIGVRVILIRFALFGGICYFLYAFPPDDWHGLPAMLDQLRHVLPAVAISVALQMLYHLDISSDRRLPPWRASRPAALAVEAF